MLRFSHWPCGEELQSIPEMAGAKKQQIVNMLSSWAHSSSRYSMAICWQCEWHDGACWISQPIWSKAVLMTKQPAIPRFWFWFLYLPPIGQSAMLWLPLAEYSQARLACADISTRSQLQHQYCREAANTLVLCSISTASWVTVSQLLSSAEHPSFVISLIHQVIQTVLIQVFGELDIFLARCVNQRPYKLWSLKPHIVHAVPTPMGHYQPLPSLLHSSYG